jgi:hypothetical protein
VKKTKNTLDAASYKLHDECAHDAMDIIIENDEDVINFNDSRILDGSI